MMEMSREINLLWYKRCFFKRIKFNTSFIGLFEIVFSRLKQGDYLFKSINSLKGKFTWLSAVNGSFHSFLPRIKIPLIFVVLIVELRKQFLPKISLLRASNPNIIISLKNKQTKKKPQKKKTKEKKGGGERIKYQNQIKETKHILENRTYYQLLQTKWGWRGES